MAKISESENILCSLKTHKEIKNSLVASNVISNLLSGGIAGRVVNDSVLTLTQRHLYIALTSYSPWGGAAETNNEYIIPIKDIESFNVAEENNENVITITINGNSKKMVFICNNGNDNKMAIKMFELIPGLK